MISTRWAAARSKSYSTAICEAVARYASVALGGRSTRPPFSEARQFIEDKENGLIFSTASLWEVVIKRGLGRDDFKVDPRLLRRGLLDNGYSELPISSEHVVVLLPHVQLASLAGVRRSPERSARR